MGKLAINIEMSGRKILIAGGGKVALRKLIMLLDSNAEVHIVSPHTISEIEKLAADGKVVVTKAEYCAGLLGGVFLVIAATGDNSINRQICSDAAAAGILSLSASEPERGDCSFPAVLKRGDLVVAVSSGGQCPSFAADVRDEIGTLIGSEYGDVLRQLAVEREKLLTNGSSSTYNTQVLRSLAVRLLTKYSESGESVP